MLINPRPRTPPIRFASKPFPSSVTVSATSPFERAKLRGDTAAVTARLDRLLHHAHVLKCGPRSWRTKVQTDLRPEDASK
jgi:hypothetical protein